MQRRVALWIVGTFKTSSLMNVEAIASLISINLHLQKIGGRSQLRVHSLPSNHILWSLMSPSLESLSHQHALLLNSLTRKQHGLIKDHIVDMENCFNKVLPSFNPINPEFFPGNCYGMLWILTFFVSFYLFFLILYFFSFEFLFLFLFLVMMKRHMTSQSHDISHDVMS